MVEIGRLAVWLACLVAAHASLTSMVSAAIRREAMARSARSGLFVVFGLLTFASAILVYSFISRDFQVEYVYSYSDRALPVFYAASAFWAGQKGSLLLWAWLLSLFCVIALATMRKQNAAIEPHFICVLACINFFFLLLIVAAADPFEKLPFMPSDGLGLNPLLQNPQMVFHPPTLYLGYVGFSVPFAYAMAAMWSGERNADWIVPARRWSLFSWYFLGLGILLGAQWAYVELGWGGYWSWDPVENASLLPWLTGTALVHCLMVEYRTRMLRAWNMALIIATFGLTIFGTFITRSGVISSVHAFGRSAFGYYFLFFLAAILVWSLVLLRGRWKELRQGRDVESLLSREGGVMLSSFIMLGAACAVFWGTVFPVLWEAVQGVKVAVGPPFFNRVNAPIGLALLFLMGFCPQLVWGRAAWDRLRKRLVLPGLAAVFGAAALALAGVRHPWALAAFALGVFGLVATGRAFLRRGADGDVGAEAPAVAPVRSLRVPWRRPYGGYLIHVGIILILVGIAGSSAYKKELQVTLRRGESVLIGGHTVRYDGLTVRREPDKEVHSATLSLYNRGRPAGVLMPERNFYYSHPAEPTSEVAISSTLKEDLYTILSDYTENGEAATLILVVNPLLVWLWIGGVAVTVGWICVIADERRRGGSSRSGRRTPILQGGS